MHQLSCWRFVALHAKNNVQRIYPLTEFSVSRNYCNVETQAVATSDDDSGLTSQMFTLPQGEKKPKWAGPKKLSHAFLLPALYRWGAPEPERRAYKAAENGEIRYVVAYQRCTSPRGPKLLWVKGDMKEYKIVKWDEILIFDSASRFLNMDMLQKTAKAIPCAREKAFDMQDITEGDVFIKLNYQPKIVKCEKYIREVIRMCVFDSLFFSALRRAEDNTLNKETFAVEARERLFQSCLAPYSNMDTAYALQEAVSVLFKNPQKIVNQLWLEPDPAKPYVEQQTLLEEIMDGLPDVDPKIQEEYATLIADQHARGLCLVVLSAFMYSFHRKCNFDLLSVPERQEQGFIRDLAQPLPLQLNNTPSINASADTMANVETRTQEENGEYELAMQADDLSLSDLVETDLNQLAAAAAK